jgi:hypothetical protein
VPEIQAGGGCLLLRMAQHRTAPGLDILAANNQPRMPHILWPPASAMEASSSRARSSFSCFAYSLSFSSSLPASCCRFHTSSRFWMRPGCHVFYSTRGGAGAAVSGRCGVKAVGLPAASERPGRPCLVQKGERPRLLAHPGARWSSVFRPWPSKPLQRTPCRFEMRLGPQSQAFTRMGNVLASVRYKTPNGAACLISAQPRRPAPIQHTEARTQDWKRL